MARRSRRWSKPEVARLESRDVPTVISPLAFGGAGLMAQREIARANARLGGDSTPASATGTISPNVAGGGGGSANPTLDPATLTPIGLTRARFLAKTTGPYALGKPSFTDVSKDITYLGSITTNQILHANFIMRITIPTDPTMPITGIASLRDRNSATTGTEIVLDLTIMATDSYGRPTRGTWLIDSGSGGAYSSSAGQGTMTITYQRNGHSKNSVGGATTVFQGLILSTGTGSNINYDVPKFN